MRESIKLKMEDRMSEFDKAFHKLMEVEGGYVDHPSDLGGPTHYGITHKTAVEYGYLGDMRELPQTLAKEIYKDKYWYSQHLDSISQLAPAVAAEMFDTGVNMGSFWAALFLQQSLNAFNKKETLWYDIKEDGQVGSLTIQALQNLIRSRGDEGLVVLVKAMDCLQGARYLHISEKRQDNEDFTYGWIKERIG